jgi:hypothetical protein
MVEALALLHAALEFEHVIDFGCGPALTLDIFQLEAARTIHIVLEAALAEDEVVREIHTIPQYLLPQRRRDSREHRELNRQDAKFAKIKAEIKNPYPGPPPCTGEGAIHALYPLFSELT